MANNNRLDKFFGGARGSADRKLKEYQGTYGRTRGKRVFDGIVAKREHAHKKGRRGR